MIVPMKKVTLVLLDRERRSALRALRRVGVFHPAIAQGLINGEAARELADKRSKAHRVRVILEEIQAAEKKNQKKKTVSQNNLSDFHGDGHELVETVLRLSEEKQNLNEEKGRDKAEFERLASWGNIDPADFDYLAERGVHLRLIELSKKAHDQVTEETNVITLGSYKKKTRALLVSSDDRLPLLPDEAVIIDLPRFSSAELSARVAKAEKRSRDIDDELRVLSKQRPVLEQYILKLDASIEFETLHHGAVSLMESGEPEALVALEGFLPDEELPKIAAAAKANAWAFIADEPGPDDQVPVKTKNSAFIRIVDPIFAFLGTVPNYREYDISAWFLLFFCFFFAMIFGDAGYGALLFASGLGLAFMAKKKKKPVPDAVRLLLLLSSFTVLWGVLTLSYFGIQAEYVPSFLKKIDINWLSSANPESGDNVKIFCFFLGTIQLILAHLKNIKRDIGSLKFLSQLGQLLMVTGMLSLVLNLVIDAERFPLPKYSLPLIGVGFILNFLFANYEGGASFLRSLGGSVVASLKNIVSVFLGVVNVFADIVSYIRLWAVGLAGVAISQTVNDMVGPLFGEALFFFIAIAILVLGHGINLVLSLLSVIVHGVRLNMLEFSGHLGMEWSGFAYDPFRERAPDTPQKELS